LSELRGHARAAGETGEVNPLQVYGKALLRIADHGFGGLELRLPRAIARIIRNGNEVAVDFRGVLKLRESQRAASERIESVNDWPTLFARILCGDVERVALLRVLQSYDPWDQIPGREGLRVLCLLAAEKRSGRYGCNEKRCQENAAHIGSINARDGNWLALRVGNSAAERVQSFLVLEQLLSK
jgi:hypothetical protein